MAVYRTYLNGYVHVASDGESVSISSDKTVSKEDIMTPGSGGNTTPPSSVDTDYIV